MKIDKDVPIHIEFDTDATTTIFILSALALGLVSSLAPDSQTGERLVKIASMNVFKSADALGKDRLIKLQHAMAKIAKDVGFTDLQPPPPIPTDTPEGQHA